MPTETDFFQEDLARIIHEFARHRESHEQSGLANAVDDMRTVYDEPFSYSSQVPTVRASRLTREHLTVTLTGDGGDEVFGGFNRHVHVARLQRMVSSGPLTLRRCAAAMARVVPTSLVDRIAATDRRSVLQGAGNRLHKPAWLAGARTLDEPCGRWRRLPRPGLGLVQPACSPVMNETLARCPPAERFTWLDIVGYFPDVIQEGVDRASLSWMTWMLRERRGRWSL